MQEQKKSKWDNLYNPDKKSLIAKLEELAKNWHFDKVFENSIISASNIKNGKILEPGCGSGVISAKLAKRGNDVVVLDLSWNAIVKALSKFEEHSVSCKFAVGDLFHLPFRDNTFDLVFNQGVIEHFKLAGLDPVVTVREMMRVLKKNGTLIILAPAFLSPLHIIYSILEFFNLVDKLWPFERQEFLRKKELCEIMSKGHCEKIAVKRLWSSFFFSIIAYCKKNSNN